MRKIVFFTGSNDLYGANRILLNVIGLFTEYERVLCLPCKGELTELAQTLYPGIRIVEIPDLPVIAKMFLSPKGIVRFVSNVARASLRLKKTVPKDAVVYLNTLAVLPVALFLRNQKYLHVHEILPNSSATNRAVNKLALKLVKNMVCVSKAVALNFEELGCSKDRLKIVHNGISSILPYVKNDEGGEEQKLKLTLIGRIKPSVKGQNYALDALKLLAPEIREKIQLTMVGSPVVNQESDLEDLERRISEENLGETVKIHGFTNNIGKYYETSDICLVPSVSVDSLPTTVLEAMSAGLPVIGTEIGGIPEMIDDGETGFLIPLGDASVFSERITRLVTDVALRKDMGRKGYEKYLREFTIQGFADRYKKALPELFK